MVRKLAAALFLAGAAPALAQTALPCRMGALAKDSHVLLERIESRVEGAAARVEFHLSLRNPWPWPVALMPGINLPGVVEAVEAPLVLAPRGHVQALLGWVPVAVVPRPPVPEDQAVRAAFNLPFCVVLAPERAGPAVASAHPAVPARGVEVIRHERPQQLLQRL